jgi:light-regulated signal transduction histidine kinase (bacteriophytochrome)
MKSSSGGTECKEVQEALQNSTKRTKLFAYSVAHDLKGPAVGIHGLAKRLHTEYHDSLDKQSLPRLDYTVPPLLPVESGKG